MYEETTEKLLEFISKSPTAFQAAEETRRRFLEEGFTELKEEERWELEKGGKYFVMRNHSAIIGFSIPVNDCMRYHIIASHSDSPSFKIKENPEMSVNGAYVKLNVERYGGMLCAPWFDRPLSVAGRIAVRTENGIETRLVNLDQDLAMIPNLAIHMNREANNGYKYNIQKDMLPIVGEASSKGKLMKLVAENAGVKEEDILSTDLFLYNRVKGTVWGLEKEFLSAGRLDDLQCAFASMKGFLGAVPGESVPVCAVFDNEEVGSTTKQGAGSTFLQDVIDRICESIAAGAGEKRRMLAASLMASADNGHAIHPNHPEKADKANYPVMNGGVVIKYSANQKYTTDAVSAGLFKVICAKAEVPLQVFINRSDVLGGSTLGNISGSHVALNTVDIGLAQLAMHSPYETGGNQDTLHLLNAMKALYSTEILCTQDGEYQVL